MTYFGEFKLNWRPLLAAAVGMAFGYTLNNYLSNVFVPPLVREFHWPRSSVALIGLAALLSLVFQPLAGRVTDRWGVRAVALFGIIAGPVLFFLASLQRGQFWAFFLLNVLQIAFFASTTGAVVYSRLIAQRFDLARGMALAIAACSPSIAGAVIVSPLSHYIEQHGWRAAYVVVAIIVAAAGLLTLFLIPANSSAPPQAPGNLHSSKEFVDYRAIFRMRPFRLIALGLGLCSISVTVQATQLKFVIESFGVAPTQAAVLLSLYATGVIAGRLSCGAALDRFSSYAVASAALGLPGAGLLILSLGMATPFMMALAVILLGLSLGTELDVAGYLVMSYFDLNIYSAVLGIMIGVIALFGALGSLVLSFTLHLSPSYAPYLVVSALAAFIGSRLLWQLKNCRHREHAVVVDPDSVV
jgi:MFS family permease